MTKHLLKEDLKEILVETSKLIFEKNFEYLIYSNKGRIREPELRCLLSSVLSKKKIFYGIEVPTQKKYSFSKNNISKRITSARTDLAIYENNNPIINIELKEGLQSIDKIEKDFEKLFLEEVIGTAFFHVINNKISQKTLSKLSERYFKAQENIKEKLEKNNSKTQPKWFILFIILVKEKEIHYQLFDNIETIKKVNLTKI
jgi:mRNA-degrading endonuclease HigB of HigAB toxin-antitoxin module